MTASLVTIRDEIETAINADKASYVITDFTVIATWLPRESLESLAAIAGKIYIIGMGSTETSRSRTGTALTEYPVQVGIQKVLTGNTDSDANKTLIDQLVELQEQVRVTCRKLGPAGFSWNRSEPLEDDSGLPFSFMLMHENNTFEAYFTAFYAAVLA